MACLEEEQTDGVAQVTFLYSLMPGLASRSHGYVFLRLPIAPLLKHQLTRTPRRRLNVARMAELPESVLKRALEKSRELEEIMAAKARSRVVDRLRKVVLALAGGAGIEPQDVVTLCRDAARKGSL